VENGSEVDDNVLSRPTPWGKRKLVITLAFESTHVMENSNHILMMWIHALRRGGKGSIHSTLENQICDKYFLCV
jgi:hypothetical protein